MGSSETAWKVFFRILLFLSSQCSEGSICVVSGCDSAESLVYSPASPDRTA